MLQSPKDLDAVLLDSDSYKGSLISCHLSPISMLTSEIICHWYLWAVAICWPTMDQWISSCRCLPDSGNAPVPSPSVNAAHRPGIGCFTCSSRPGPLFPLDCEQAAPPGAQPGGNWVEGSEYASSLNQPPHPTLCTAFQPAHPRLDSWNSTPFLLAPPPPPSFSPASSPPHCTTPRHVDQRLIWSGPRRLSLPSSAASRPRPTTPDRSVVAATVQCSSRLAAA